MTNDRPKKSGRRAFLKTAAVAGTASFAAQTARATTPARKLRIGAMGVKPSFISFSWSDLMETDKEPNSPRRGNFGTPFLNMDITHVWDIDPDTAQTYADRLDAVAVKSYDGMVGNIDGVIFGGMNEVPWFKHLTRPYLEAQIPCYLSRPFAYCLRDIDDILETAAKHNTPILCTAKFEHYNEVPALRAKLPDLGTIKLVHATGNSRDFPMHFHIMFMMMRILGYDVREVSVVTDGDRRNSYCQLTMLYNGPEGKPPFLCTVHGVDNRDQFTVTMFGEKHTVTTNMLRSPEWRDSLLFRYGPQVIAMQRTFEGELLEPYEDIRKKTELWLTAYYSWLEKGGAPVEVGSVPVDWRAPYPEPDWIDEGMFG